MGLFHLVVALLLSTFFPSITAQGATDATAILAQLQSELPPCALACMLDEIPKSSCSFTDSACICTSTDLADALVGCLGASCTVREALVTQRFQSTTCGAPVRNIGKRVSIVMWIFFSFAAVAVVCRGIARLPQLGGSFAWDDYTIFLCMLTLTPSAVCGQLMLNAGLGQDIWMLSPEQISSVLHYFYIELFLYVLLVHFTKLSILLFYLRIFTTRAFKIKCYILLGFTAATFISSFMVLPFMCRPQNFFWRGWDGSMGRQEDHCVDINLETYIYAGINMTVDILILLLPIPQVIHLQMNLKKKLGIIAIFTIGVFVTVCSVVRLPTALKWGKTMNPTYDYTHLALWSLLEMMSGVICACFPGLASLLRRIAPKVFGTTHKASKYSDGPYDLNKNSGTGSSIAPKGIYTKTSVLVAYADQTSYKKRDQYGDQLDTARPRSDELELTSRTDYRPQGNSTRYSEDSNPNIAGAV